MKKLVLDYFCVHLMAGLSQDDWRTEGALADIGDIGVTDLLRQDQIARTALFKIGLIVVAVLTQQDDAIAASLLCRGFVTDAILSHVQIIVVAALLCVSHVHLTALLQQCALLAPSLFQPRIVRIAALPDLAPDVRCANTDEYVGRAEFALRQIDA